MKLIVVVVVSAIVFNSNSDVVVAGSTVTSTTASATCDAVGVATIAIVVDIQKDKVIIVTTNKVRVQGQTGIVAVAVVGTVVGGVHNCGIVVGAVVGAVIDDASIVIVCGVMIIIMAVMMML